MTRIRTHWHIGTWHHGSPLPTSFYYDFTNSSLNAILQDWDCEDSSTITYDTNKWLYRNVSSWYPLFYKVPINLSNVTKQLKITMNVHTRSSGWALYWGTHQVLDEGNYAFWFHENSYQYCIRDSYDYWASTYPTRSITYDVDGIDTAIWDFETNKMTVTVVWGWSATYNMTAWQLDRIKTCNVVMVSPCTMWIKDVLIERE